MSQTGAELGLALIGCGEVTRAKHLPAICSLPDFKLVALADIDTARAARMAEAFGVARHVGSVGEILSLPGVAAVGVCTPPATHAEIAATAFRAGKHVWIDKPLALAAEDCRLLIEERRRAGTLAMTGFHMRFHRLVRQARERIQSGCLGPLESVRVVWHSPRGDDNTPEWKTKRALGGGALTEIAVHHFDLVRFLLDSEIEEIVACSRDEVRDDECAVVTARMSNGVLVAGEFSERSPHEIEIVVNGRAGQLKVDLLRFDGLELRGAREVPGDPAIRIRSALRLLRELPAGISTMRQGGDYRISYKSAWGHFAAAIRAGKMPEATLEDGLRATQAVCAALESRTRRVVVAVPRGIDAESRPAGAAAGVAPDASGLTFSVVVPTWNRCAQLWSMLDALAGQDFPSSRFEVVVVDDGSTQPVETVVSGFQRKLNIRLIRLARGGCAAARQRGVEASRGTFIAFTDDDCRPSPDWLSRLHSALERRPGNAVGGPTRNALGKNLCAEASQLVVNALAFARHNGNGGARFNPTTNLAFPAAALRRIGGLDPGWTIPGGEDRDVCARWVEAGLSLRPEPRACVYHYHGLSLWQLIRQHYHYGRGAWQFHTSETRGGARSVRSFEPLGFYAALFAIPFRTRSIPSALALTGLVGFTQLATAAGFGTEAVATLLGLRRRKTSGQVDGRCPVLPANRTIP